jgi:hypothetical protein
MKAFQLGGSIHQISFIKHLSVRFELVTIDNVPRNPGHIFSSLHNCVSTTDIQSISRLINKPPFILSSHASDISERSRLALLNRNHSIPFKLTEKSRAREIIKEASMCLGFPFIQSISPDLSNSTIVIKPNIGSGSRGVAIVDSKDTKLVNDATAKAALVSLDNKVHIEECFSGSQAKYYCEGYYLAHASPSFIWGISIQRKGTLFNIGNVQLGHSLDDSVVSKHLSRFITHMGKRIGQAFFPYNIDFFIDNDIPVIIEFSCRPGGNGLAHIHNITTDNSYYNNLISYYITPAQDPSAFVSVQPGRMMFSSLMHTSADPMPDNPPPGFSCLFTEEIHTEYAASDIFGYSIYT